MTFLSNFRIKYNFNLASHLSTPVPILQVPPGQYLVVQRSIMIMMMIMINHNNNNNNNNKLFLIIKVYSLLFGIVAKRHVN